MRKTKLFKVGDKVFAKVKGYPPWPAVVIKNSGKKFSVQFYGTGEIGYIKPEDLFYYLKHKNRYMKGSKKKEFHDALTEIEEAIANDGGHDGSSINNETPQTNSVVQSKKSDDKPGKRKRTISDKSSDGGQSVKKYESESETNQTPLDLQNEESNTSRNHPETSDLEDKSEELKQCNNDENTNSDAPTVKTELKSELEIEDTITTKPSDPLKDEPIDYEMKIISEEELNQNILYANFIKKNPELYQCKPVEPRIYFINQVLPVYLPMENKYLALKIHTKWPIKFENEYDSAIYDADISINAINNKNFIEKEMIRIKRKEEKYKRLQNEMRLVELDLKIRDALNIESAKPDDAILAIDEMYTSNFDKLLLKKHIHIVEVIKTVRAYVGNISEWDFDDKALKQFELQAKTIRTKACMMYEKFKECYDIKDDEEFWNVLIESVRVFEEKCKDLKLKEIFLLTCEPDTREAFYNRLNDKAEEIKSDDDDDDDNDDADAGGGVGDDDVVEKENSSEAANSDN